MKLAKTYNYVKKDLNMIEESLKNTIKADHIVLQDASTQLLEAGGKRIRPVFVLLSGQMGSYNIDRFKTVAVALELIHMATLVHDDVVDNSELRRGKPTVKYTYGNRVAMYTGNYILALAIECITKIKDPKIHQLLSNTLVEVCLGEVEQIEFKYNWNQQLRHYLRRIKRKTALLIATSCKLGAMAGMTTPEEANRLYRYGYYIGMSYQIIDDILDFTSTEKELGKPIASDLLQGNLTLPVLYAMKDQTFNDLLRDTFAHPNEVDPVHFEKLLFMLKKSNAIEKSYQLSELYLNKALEVLKPLPDLEAKQILQEIAQSIGSRRS